MNPPTPDSWDAACDAERDAFLAYVHDRLERLRAEPYPGLHTAEAIASVFLGAFYGCVASWAAQGVPHYGTILPEEQAQNFRSILESCMADTRASWTAQGVEARPIPKPEPEVAARAQAKAQAAQAAKPIGTADDGRPIFATGETRCLGFPVQVQHERGKGPPTTEKGTIAAGLTASTQGLPVLMLQLKHPDGTTLAAAMGETAFLRLAQMLHDLGELAGQGIASHESLLK